VPLDVNDPLLNESKWLNVSFAKARHRDVAARGALSDDIGRDAPPTPTGLATCGPRRYAGAAVRRNRSPRYLSGTAAATAPVRSLASPFPIF
jgi:hypothetical protein